MNDIAELTDAQVLEKYGFDPILRVRIEQLKQHDRAIQTRDRKHGVQMKLFSQLGT